MKLVAVHERISINLHKQIPAPQKYENLQLI